MKLYSIYDKKACLFATPFASHNNQTAKRQFPFIINNFEQYQIGKEDMDLYFVGEIDYNTGVISPVQPDFLCNFMEVSDV